ncbi:isoamyl acetate-hydrolyzing esterase [Borealophlyctis nickersoniae]|nr:isoamyl acetate-hydrolyzing esterase [Borealophlyctis nickersoniae]
MTMICPAPTPFSSPPAPPPLTLPTILLLGDSLTQWSFNPPSGWALPLQHAYIRRADTINRGFSGYISTWLLHLLPSILASQPDLLFTILWIGTNDAALEGVGGKYHVEVEVYKRNLERMVELIRAHGSVGGGGEQGPGQEEEEEEGKHRQSRQRKGRVILLTPPPVHDRLWATHRAAQSRPPDRTYATTRLYHLACLSVAKELDVPVIDTWELFQNTRLNKVLSDGVHLNEEGSVMVGRAVLEVVEKEMAGVSVPMRVRGHTEVESEDLEGTLFYHQGV